MSRPLDKPFDSLGEDVFFEVATLIAANESRPQFLINVFRELQLISTTDPLRDRLMDAFHGLYNRHYSPNNYLGVEQRSSEFDVPHSRGPVNPMDKNNGSSSTGRTQTVGVLTFLVIKIYTYLLVVEYLRSLDSPSVLQ